ncbi:UDP-glycosyltransferase 87A1-like [Phragmites australis]|uniref:UDP-glycosyltransferase 87A1-like n=1 Tax=Phragmites australis TaxID=29695 RepID=UPI002D77EF90|nr:UDP-glycosyltransferase 87A1-like [Phragmites australis]
MLNTTVDLSASHCNTEEGRVEKWRFFQQELRRNTQTAKKMDAAAAAAARHVVAVPYPGRGHINPMLVVCRQLAAADSALTVTIVVTEEWLALLASAGVPPTLPERVRLATVPNVIPSERDRGADHVGFIDAVRDKMREPFERLLDRLVLERRPVAILADTYLTWGVAVGAQHGIPVCSLWTMPATFFLALYHLDRWPLADGREGEEEQSCKSLDQYVPFPALSQVKCSDINIFPSWELSMKRSAEVFSNVRKAQCVLFTSFYELEACAINGISQVVPYPIYTVGPSIPHMPLERHTDKIHHEKYSNWLDAQPKNSVLYVSFGSYVSLSTSQLEEIAIGLHDSAVRFFWVARDNATTTSLHHISGDKGLVVPWCDQLKILCHPSIGGFMSHCGWNSTLEAVFVGVPLLAFPVACDQLVNGRLVANEWKTGINLREQKREDGIVSRAAISAAVTKLMDLDNGDSQEMRRRAAELRDASRSAIQEGGSSWSALDSFVKYLIERSLNAAKTSH